MKKILACLALVILAGCGPETNPKDAQVMVDGSRDFEVLCLEGVQYWAAYIGTNGGVLSPRIDKDTLLPVRCSPTTPAPQEQGNF